MGLDDAYDGTGDESETEHVNEEGGIRVRDSRAEEDRDRDNDRVRSQPLGQHLCLLPGDTILSHIYLMSKKL